MLKQLVRVGSLVVVLHQHRLDEVLELGAPALGLESGRRIPGNEEERPHGMHVAQRRLRLGHLDGRDAETPQVAAVVVRCVRILITGNHLQKRRAHSSGCPMILCATLEVPTSGAIQYGVPINVFLLPTVLSSCALTPKSTSLTSALSVSNTFWPLISL